MIIAVDFDGTLHMGQFPEIGIPMPYAIQMMRKLKEDGHYIIINTCRSNGNALDAVNWLLEKGIPFDAINANHAGNVAKYKNDTRKIYAHCYVDDKQVGGLPTWPEIYEWITERERAYQLTVDS